MLVIDPAVAPGDLLDAPDLHALPLLEHADEVARGVQHRERAGVEPRGPARQHRDRQPAFAQVVLVDGRDLELAARARPDAAHGPAVDAPQ